MLLSVGSGYLANAVRVSVDSLYSTPSFLGGACDGRSAQRRKMAEKQMTTAISREAKCGKQGKLGILKRCDSRGTKMAGNTCKYKKLGLLTSTQNGGKQM